MSIFFTSNDFAEQIIVWKKKKNFEAKMAWFRSE